MSQVKFEKETVKATTGGKEDFMHNIGEAITKGSGPNGYLAVSVHTSSDANAILRACVASVAQ